VLGDAWAILERVPRAPDGESATPKVLGVGDWAHRRANSYGTILLYLERKRVSDI
jgi:hypothetical protein